MVTVAPPAFKFPGPRVGPPPDAAAWFRAAEVTAEQLRDGAVTDADLEAADTGQAILVKR